MSNERKVYFNLKVTPKLNINYMRRYFLSNGEHLYSSEKRIENKKKLKREGLSPKPEFILSFY